MRQQLLPLLLCLFTTFTVLSSATKDVENTKTITELTIDIEEFTLNKSLIKNTVITPSKKNIAKIEINKKNKDLALNTVRTSKNIKNKNSVFSYKNKSVTSLTNLAPIHFDTNLFNQGLFYGFALTIILLNLVCYFIFDEGLFSVFSLSFAAITTTLFFTEGLYPLLGITEVIQPEIFQSSLLFFTTGLSAYFASKFLITKDILPKLYLITIPMFVISSFLLGLALATKNTLFSNISNTLLLATVAIYFIVGIVLFSRNNYAKFYVIACFIPLLFLFDFYVLQSFGIGFLFTEAIHLKIAMLFKALILSYAILYRMQAVKEEDVLRQTEMRIFLKRQDVMNRNKVEELIEDIYLENLIMQYDLDGFEIKLLQYISEGKSNEKIARKLKISQNELGEVTKELYQKLEISEQIKEDHRLIDKQPDYIYN